MLKSSLEDIFSFVKEKEAQVHVQLFSVLEARGADPRDVRLQLESSVLCAGVGIVCILPNGSGAGLQSPLAKKG